MGAPKLTEQDVRAIKARLPWKFNREIEKQIAEEYGVSDDCVHDIARGKTWRHVV